MQGLPAALAPLGNWRQFIVYKLSPKKDRPGKMNKFPVDYRTGRVMEEGAQWQRDPATMCDAATAIATAARLGSSYGVGFLFTPNDPFFFLDVDECLEQPPGEAPRWSALAVELCNRLSGAAVEVSQSGRGLHIIGTGNPGAHGCKNGPMGIELYTEWRFVALTGVGATGNAAADVTPALTTIAAQFFPVKHATDGATTRPEEWTTAPRPEYTGPVDDDELIAKMLSTGLNAGNLFGTRASVADLWNCNVSALSRAYPDHYNNPPREYDASSADAALAAHLAFWTGGDCERSERLMRRSKLVRDKWDRHGSYLSRTITGAVSRCEKVYGQRQAVEQRVDQPQPESNATPGVEMEGETDQPEILTGFQYLAITQQIEHFRGCVYVQDVHRVFTPRGALLKPEQFKATYGGFVFSLDAGNDKVTKSAWEAFTESQAVRYPIAEGMTFRPDLPPGKLITEEGRRLVNTYMPAQVERVKGDVSPFLTHVGKLLPVERDARILLSYLAACVQHIGVKFQWAPLLQGVEGNGKTLFSRCVAYAVGSKFSHWPKAEEVGNKFNSWMVGKLFIGIEDIYYPEHKGEILQSLLPLITNDRIAVEFKGIDQITARVCANFIMNANRKDALRKTRNDRRFCMFFTAQQHAADLERDGMGGDYFPDLYDWLKGTGRYQGQAPGYAMVANYLATYPIEDELNPATHCHRAPITSTTHQAIAQSVGTVEQEIQEAIEEGRPGFAGGWVSSMALDRLLEGMRKAGAIPQNRRREIMQGMGYDWHPALRDGRVNNPIALDGGGKPRLFILANHPDRGLESPAAVATAYQRAQETAGLRLADRVFGVPRQGS